MLKDQSLLNLKAVADECAILEAEMECILSKVIELGQGDIAVGAVRAFEAGVIDVPFAPSKYNLGKALPARDDDGAVRFLDCGHLPFSDEIKNFHIGKLEARGKKEKRAVSFQMVIDDIYAIGKGYLVGRPK